MIDTRNPARIAELPDVLPTNDTETPDGAAPTNAKPRSLARRMFGMMQPTRRKGTALTLGLGVVAMGIAFHPLLLNQVRETNAAEPAAPLEPIEAPEIPPLEVEPKSTDKPVTVEPITPEFELPAPIIDTKTENVENVELPPPPAAIETDKPAKPLPVPMLNIPAKSTEVPEPKLDVVQPLKFDDLPAFTSDGPKEAERACTH